MALGNESTTLCFLLAIITLTHATRQHRTPSTTFQQETSLPSSNNFLEGSLTLDQHPVRVSAGFHLKPPPRLRLLPRLPLQLAGFDFPRRPAHSRERLHIPPFPAAFLFTPNTIEQTAETKGQIEEYEKGLREEIEQDRATTAGTFLEADDLEGSTQPTHFVSVRSKEYNYKYSV